MWTGDFFVRVGHRWMNDWGDNKYPPLHGWPICWVLREVWCSCRKPSCGQRNLVACGTMRHWAIDRHTTIWVEGGSESGPMCVLSCVCCPQHTKLLKWIITSFGNNFYHIKHGKIFSKLWSFSFSKLVWNQQKALSASQMMVFDAINCSATVRYTLLRRILLEVSI